MSNCHTHHSSGVEWSVTDLVYKATVDVINNVIDLASLSASKALEPRHSHCICTGRDCFWVNPIFPADVGTYTRLGSWNFRSCCSAELWQRHMASCLHCSMKKCACMLLQVKESKSKWCHLNSPERLNFPKTTPMLPVMVLGWAMMRDAGEAM